MRAKTLREIGLRKAIGAKVEMLMRFKESPEPPQENCGGGDPNKIFVMGHSAGATHVAQQVAFAVQVADGKLALAGKTTLAEAMRGAGNGERDLAADDEQHE